MENAALWYWQAVALLPSREVLSDEEKRFLSRLYDDPQAPVPGSLAYRIHPDLHERAYELAERGANRSHCHFAVPHDEGLGALLPHISHMRDLAAWLTLDARQALKTGKVDRAARRLGTVYRLAQHIGADGGMLNALVGLRMFTLADSLVAAALRDDAFGQDERQVLLVALATIDETNPLGFAQCMRFEQAIFQATLESWTEPGGQRCFLEFMSALADAGDAHCREAMLLMPSGIEESARHLAALMNRLADAFENPDLKAAARQIASIEEEIDQADDNDHTWLLARCLASEDYSRVHSEYRSFVSALSARRRLLAD